MTNVNSSEDLTPILNVLNDFTLTVLGPLPHNSQLLSLWYKFKPLLAPETYDPSKVQAFISNLDNEVPSATFKKPPLSSKLPPDTSVDGSRDHMQPPQNNGSSRGEYEINKKSANSTQSSNSVDYGLPKGKGSGFSLKQETQNLGNRYDARETSVSGKGGFNQGNTSIRYSGGQDNSFDHKQEMEGSRKGSRNYEGSLDNVGKTVSEGNAGRVNASGNNSAVKQNISQQPKCLPALDFVNTYLKKPYTGASDSSLYTRSILESKQGRYTFYYSLIVTHFLHLLSDRSTSLVLSSLYEKVVIRKLQLVYYNNQDKLYESLTTSLKALIREKIAKPGQVKVLQELFLNKFYGDKFFREGLVAVMKELFVDYATGLDEKSFGAQFGQQKLEKLITSVRSSEGEPSEEVISVFPNLIEANIEVYYVKTSKIDQVVYTQKAPKSYKPLQISLVCIIQNSERRVFHALVNKEQAELLERVEAQGELEEEEGLKGTVYMSLESNITDRSGKEQNHVDSDALGENQKKKTTGDTIPKLSFNRDFLFGKAQELVSFMDKHSDKLSTYQKSRNPDSKQLASQSNSSESKQNFNMFPVTKGPSSNQSQNSSHSSTPKQTITGTFTTLAQDFANSNLAAKPCTSDKVIAPGPYLNIFPQREELAKESVSATASPLLRPNNNKSTKLPPARDALRAVVSSGNSSPDSSRTYQPGGGNKTVGVCTNKSKMAAFSANTSFQALNNSENIHDSPPNRSSATKEKEKENENVDGPPAKRSPLKNIIVYTHDKDAAFAAVEKEVTMMDAILKNSPDGSAGPDRLIFEDHIC